MRSTIGASQSVHDPESGMRSPGVLVTGGRVGAGRWPYTAAHPDAWLRPWSGVVLTKDDPRAWTGTIAFSKRPTRSQVRDHLDDLARRGLAVEDVPVIWDFDGERVVRWESRNKLVTVEEDLRRWTAARAAAIEGEGQRASRSWLPSARRSEHLQAA